VNPDQFELEQTEPLPLDIDLESVAQELRCTRQKASKYLDELVNIGLLEKLQIARENFYLNIRLYDLLLNASNFIGESAEIHKH
jgi:DNA-binding IclR family transcriptional regulator